MTNTRNGRKNANNTEKEENVFDGADNSGEEHNGSFALMEKMLSGIVAELEKSWQLKMPWWIT